MTKYVKTLKVGQFRGLATMEPLRFPFKSGVCLSDMWNKNV